MAGELLLALFFILSILFSFLCSIWEAVLLSISPSYVEQVSANSEWVGQKLKAFKKDIDVPLSGILTLNTLAHTVGAIGVGAQAAKLWGATYFEVLGFKFTGEALVAAGMTLCILILSEIIPKTIGATYWKGLTNFTVYSVQFIVWLLFPLVWLSKMITGLLKKDGEKSVLSRTDFSVMAAIGAREGIIKQGEYTIINNLLKFNEVRAKDVMTPRTVMVSSDENELIGDYYEKNPNLRFSRVPIFKEKVDEMTGYFLKDALLKAVIDKKKDQPLSTLKRSFTIVNEVESIAAIFDTLIAKKEQIALVVDEFGGVSGILTTEDIIETLFGLEIMDELDHTADMQHYAREQWKKRAKKMGILENEE